MSVCGRRTAETDQPGFFHACSSVLPGPCACKVEVQQAHEELEAHRLATVPALGYGFSAPQQTPARLPHQPVEQAPATSGSTLRDTPREGRHLWPFARLVRSCLDIATHLGRRAVCSAPVGRGGSSEPEEG